MPTSALSPEVLSNIVEAIRSVRFGSIQIVIHNSRVVQIEKSEKVRFDASPQLTSAGASEPTRVIDRTTGGSRIGEAAASL